MKAALFSMGSTSSKRVLEAMGKSFDEAIHYDIRKVEMRIGRGTPILLYEGEELTNDLDCVYMKSSFRYALMQQALAAYFEKTAYTPIEPFAYTIVNDKTLTHLALENAGIPAPETYITPTVEAAKNLLKELNYPIILKIPGGTHGKGVMYAESVAAATGILDTLSSLKQAVLIQEYVETGGTDIRAIVVGDRVVAAMVRKAVREEKRANIHAGGSAEAIQLDTHTKKVAVQTAKALGAEICAVDILESVKGPMVLEANLSPGLQGIMQATGKDIPQDMAIFLLERTKAFKEEVNEGASAKELVGETPGAEHSVVSQLDFRGNRILLPESISQLSQFGEEEVIIKVKNGEINVRKD